MRINRCHVDTNGNYHYYRDRNVTAMERPDGRIMSVSSLTDKEANRAVMWYRIRRDPGTYVLIICFSVILASMLL